MDLSYSFGVSKWSVSRTFHTAIEILDARLLQFVKWPNHDELYKTMPQVFKTAFGNKITIIIDCFKICIEKRSNLTARAQTWSNYKHRNTIKYLIGIAPQCVLFYK